MKHELQTAAYRRFSEFYDSFMRDVDYDAWAAYLQSLLDGRLGSGAHRVLECGCGTGSLSVRLAKGGMLLTASDLSDDMLFVAGKKAAEQSLRLPLVHMDMRHIAVHQPQDAILCACDGVNYLTGDKDLSAFLDSAYASLRSGGILLFDISSAYKLSEVIGNCVFSEETDGCVYVWKNYYDDKARLLEMDLSFFAETGTLYARFDERHIQRAYAVEEIVRALQAASYDQIGVHEAFTRQPVADTSERIQFAARRP